MTVSAFGLNKVVLTGIIDDVSTAGQIYIPVPDEFQGEVVEIRSALNGAIGTGDATLTAKIGGTAMTNGTITITQSGSAAGDVDTCRPSGANYVAAGEAIEIETDGASSNTIRVFVSVVIKR
jgi:hypothetical protein